MNQSLLINDLISQNNGTLTRKALSENKISSYTINQAIENGQLEKVRPGIYVATNSTEDIFYSLQQKYKKGIYSLETALYLWNLSDQYPFTLDMTFPRGYHNSDLDFEITPHIQAQKLFSQGITKAKSFNGNTIRLYSIERTLAEIIRPINAVDIEIITNAYKTWAHKRHKNINDLLHYAQIFKVTNKVNNYLEVLL